MNKYINHWCCVTTYQIGDRVFFHGRLMEYQKKMTIIDGVPEEITAFFEIEEDSK